MAVSHAPLTPEDLQFRVPRKKGKMKVVEPPAPSLEGPVADTHAHLSMVDAPLALARCAYYGVDFLCCMADVTEDAQVVFSGLEGWLREASALVAELPAVLAAGEAERDAAEAERSDARVSKPGAELQLPKVRLAVGVHPHNAKDYTREKEEELLTCLADPRCVAVGEVGLDYHYDLSPRDVQRRVFTRQVQIAKGTGMQLVLHVREAHDEALQILDKAGADPEKTVLHCCSLSPEELAPWVQRGYRIAYGGAYTFANSQACREASHQVPLGAMVMETDSPYMAPTPLRGAECLPDFTLFTASAMAAELGFEPGESRKAFLAQLHDNALAFFDKEPTPWQMAQHLS